MTEDERTGKTVAAYYDAVADEYFRHYRRENLEDMQKYPQNYFRLQRLVQRLAVTGARSVYEVGTGEGTPLALLAGMGYEVAGCDISERMVGLTEARLSAAGIDPSRVRWADVEDAVTLAAQVAAGPYDAVVAFGVMPHVGNDEVALRNMRMLLRPGGRIYVEFRNKLFSLFTLNRLTKEFVLDDLLRDVSDDVRAAVEQELEARLAVDLPPRRGDGGAPSYDDIPAKFHNPFEVVELLRSEGFADPRLHWYHFHAAPPMLESALGVRFREESAKLEGTEDWRGHFLCSAFVVEAEVR